MSKLSKHLNTDSNYYNHKIPYSKPKTNNFNKTLTKLNKV